MKRAIFFAILVFPLLGATCLPAEPPLRPKWDVDVLPILKGKCWHCHGESTEGQLKPSTRFDMCNWAGAFSSFMPNKNAPLTGAYDTRATLVMFATVDDADLRMPPPPAEPLSEYEIEVLKRWANLPADEACKKLNPNRPPRYRVYREAEEDGGDVVVALDIWDPDGDQVFGSASLGTVKVEVRGSGRKTLRFAGGSVSADLSVELFDGWDWTRD